MFAPIFLDLLFFFHSVVHNPVWLIFRFFCGNKPAYKIFVLLNPSDKIFADHIGMGMVNTTLTALKLLTQPNLYKFLNVIE